MTRRYARFVIKSLIYNTLPRFGNKTIICYFHVSLAVDNAISVSGRIRIIFEYASVCVCVFVVYVCARLCACGRITRKKRIRMAGTYQIFHPDSPKTHTRRERIFRVVFSYFFSSPLRFPRSALSSMISRRLINIHAAQYRGIIYVQVGTRISCNNIYAIEPPRVLASQ